MPTTVDTRYGEIRGVHKQTYTVYRGVPYAQPPVGPLRWMPPQPPEPWQGVLRANRFSAKCLQAGHAPGSFYSKEFYDDEDFMPPMSEDGLYLNIWTPDGAQGLPVAFWIHGGAFVGGYGSEITFDGAGFCKRGVILVTINYRVGAPGFLAHPWLSARQGGRSGNYGTLDQIAALSWVRDNIAAFGGDPGRITIFGQSAGAMSVQTLLSSPLTKGMVAGAVMQSGGGYKNGLVRDVPLAEAEVQGERFARHGQVESAEALLEMSSERLAQLTQDFFLHCMMKGEGTPYHPCIDGHVLTVGYNQALEQGIHPDIPYMLGVTCEDMDPRPQPEQRGENPLFTGCVDFSLLNEKLGRNAAYVYNFTRKPGNMPEGAYHSSELWYLFGTLGRSRWPKQQADYDLSRRMLDYWCNFIKTGNPNGGQLPNWQSCLEESGRYVMELC